MPSMRWRAYLILSLAFLILCVGIALSVWWQDWLWFARSGCAMTMLGVLLTSQQVFDHLDRLKMRRGLSSKHRYQHPENDINPSNHDWANDPAMRRWLADDEEVSWLNERRGLVLLCFGTLVWGFGDLFNLLG